MSGSIGSGMGFNQMGGGYDSFSIESESQSVQDASTAKNEELGGQDAQTAPKTDRRRPLPPPPQQGAERTQTLIKDTQILSKNGTTFTPAKPTQGSTRSPFQLGKRIKKSNEWKSATKPLQTIRQVQVKTTRANKRFAGKLVRIGNKATFKNQSGKIMAQGPLRLSPPPPERQGAFSGAKTVQDLFLQDLSEQVVLEPHRFKIGKEGTFGRQTVSSDLGSRIGSNVNENTNKNEILDLVSNDIERPDDKLAIAKKLAEKTGPTIPKHQSDNLVRLFEPMGKKLEERNQFSKGSSVLAQNKIIKKHKIRTNEIGLIIDKKGKPDQKAVDKFEQLMKNEQNNANNPARFQQTVVAEFNHNKNAKIAVWRGIIQAMSTNDRERLTNIVDIHEGISTASGIKSGDRPIEEFTQRLKAAMMLRDCIIDGRAYTKEWVGGSSKDLQRQFDQNAEGHALDASVEFLRQHWNEINKNLRS